MDRLRSTVPVPHRALCRACTSNYRVVRLHRHRRRSKRQWEKISCTTTGHLVISAVSHHKLRGWSRLERFRAVSRAPKISSTGLSSELTGTVWRDLTSLERLRWNTPCQPPWFSKGHAQTCFSLGRSGNQTFATDFKTVLYIRTWHFEWKDLTCARLYSHFVKLGKTLRMGDMWYSASAISRIILVLL